MEHPDNHFCARCYYQDKGASSHCGQCIYDGIRGFSGWKPMNFSGSINGTTTHDIVNKPKHYMLTDTLEVRDVLAALVDKINSYTTAIPASALFESDYVQMMQYLMRFMDKNGVEDLRKAKWYLDKLIAAYD